MDISIAVSIIGLVISATSVTCAIYFSAKSRRKTDIKEIEQRIAENTRINTKLDGISSSTNDIRLQISSLVKDVHMHGERLVKAEESCKQAHKRLDTLESRINHRKDDEE